MDKNMERDGLESLRRLYYKEYGSECEVSRLHGGGSPRRYYRLRGAAEEPSVIGVVGDDMAENESFVSLSGVFAGRGLNVPSVICSNLEEGCYIVSDLGDVSLHSMLSTEEGKRMAEEALMSLPALQCVDFRDWGDKVSSGPFSWRQAMWDLNYFKYEYLKPSGITFDEDKLEDDFEKLSHTLTSISGKSMGFMYRDCQSRNVMIYEGRPWWIDFQGGRLGPALYDAVSFLWQASAPFSDDYRFRVLRAYAERYCEMRDMDVEEFLAPLPTIRLFRTLQVLGAYGLRGLVEKKAHFLSSIPGALANLRQLRDDGALADYPELERVASSMVEDARFKARKREGLTVEVFSFSYKKGYPVDYSGNGGGFMFDCRGMHNPGRYERYRSLTGLDGEVRQFLEERGEVQVFMADACRIVDRSVERYLERGFSNLQVGFGCTGGQHRSVYCAEAMATHIREKYPEVKVELCHREQA